MKLTISPVTLSARSLSDQEYVLLLPVDSAIEIFAWQSDGEEAIPVEDDATINQFCDRRSCPR